MVIFIFFRSEIPFLGFTLLDFFQKLKRVSLRQNLALPVIC